MNINLQITSVSLLPQFSKILEKLFVNKLDSFIEKYDILGEGQCGFRTNWTTSLAWTDFTEKIATDKKEHTVGVFID